MAGKIKYKLKQEKGVLHIGGGRFFYPGESYELSNQELKDYEHYFEEEKIEEDKKTTDKKQTTEDGGGGEQNSGELPKEPATGQQDGKEKDKK